MKEEAASHPASRILAVLDLLQTCGRLSGGELSIRLGVDRRTVRRYVACLEEMGIPVTAGRGPHGGYELVPGYKLPPMMFTGGEALALSLGLTAVRQFAWIDPEPAARAQAKLERVMPAKVKGRMRAVSESVEFARATGATAAESGFLPVLSAGAHARLGVRLAYRDQSGRQTGRDFDPYGLALHGGHWYTAGYCHLRRGLRTFRLDRVTEAHEQARSFERPAGFDIVAQLLHSIATLPRRFAIEVALETDLESARRELFGAIGVLEPEGRRVRMLSQADDLDWFARELARLPWPFEVRQPVELKDALRRLGGRLLKAARLTSVNKR